jgi:hypothetical protein
MFTTFPLAISLTIQAQASATVLQLPARRAGCAKALPMRSA